MGIDIHVERLGERHPDFPGWQRGGARAFDQHLNWGDDDPTGCSGNGIDINGVRPKDFARARQWVHRNFPSESRTRDWYLRALDVMEADDAVYFSISR